MNLTNDDVLKILKIIDESGYDEVRIETPDFKMHVSKHGDAMATQSVERGEPKIAASTIPQSEPTKASAKTAAQFAASSAAAPSGEEIPEGLIALRAPMLGTFYRAPSPGAEPFVEVGDKVSPDDTVCLVEVMKLFNSIKAGVAGTVVKFMVENGAMVEHGQLLILIEHELINTPGTTE